MVGLQRIRKVTKIILSVLSAFALTALLLPVVISLLLNLQSVQDFAARKATEWLASKTQTEVRIDRLHLKPFNRATIDGLYVGDYHQDTLLYIAQLEIPLRHFNPFSGKLTLGNVKLDTPCLYLMQDSTGITNLKQIFKTLAIPRKSDPKPFRLRAAALAIHDMTFRHRKLNRIERGGAVNFTDLDVGRFNLNVRNISIVNDSIRLAIDSLSLNEKSGLRINNLRTRGLILTGQSMRFRQLEIDTPDSHVEMDGFLMEYGPKWLGFKQVMDSVRFHGQIVDSRIAFRTIGYFAPGLSGRQTVFEHVTGDIEGRIRDFQGYFRPLEAGQNTRLALQFKINGLPDVKRTHFNVELESLHTSEPDIAFLVRDMAGKELASSQAEMITRMGKLAVKGRFEGTPDKFTGNAALQSSLGRMNLRLTFRPRSGGGKGFQGHLQTDHFDLGPLFEVENLGKLSLHADLDGGYGGNTFNVNTRADVGDLFFNGYHYRGVRLAGKIDNRMFTGAITSPDPNISFDFNGALDFNDSIPRYDFSLQLRNADLFKLGFNKRDSVSLLRTNLTARASGTTLDNINGGITISDMTYVNHLDTVQTGGIKLIAENNPNRKMLAMYSSFADVEYRGTLSYGNMFTYFTQTLRNYLPSLSGTEGAGRSPSGAAAAAAVPPQTTAEAVVPAPTNGANASLENYYVIRADIKEANNVAGIFVPGLRLAQGTKLSFLFNPRNDVFSLNLSSDFIERNNFFVSKLVLNSRNQSDSISFFLQSEDIFASGFYMPDFSVIGGVKENTVNLAARFDNTKNGLYAMLSTTSRVSRSPNGGPQLSIRFNPSTVANGGDTWRVFAREIVWDSTRLEVNRFSIDNGKQTLVVDGIASRSMQDTIRLRLNNFDISAFSQLTHTLGYDVGGYTNGSAEMVSALKDGIFSANVRFDSMRINHVALPDAILESRWDFLRQRARFTLSGQKERDTLLYGYFRPSDSRYLARADLKGVDLSLLDPLLQGVLDNTSGHADALLTLSNPRKKPLVNGTVQVESMRTTVDYTKVAYVLEPTRFEVTDNVMSLRDATLKDPEGNSGGLDFSFDFSHFANLKYELRIRPRQLQVLGTTLRDNDAFYGKVYASGSGVIRGSKNRVDMEITAATAGDSRFYMPLSSSGSVSRADFITFRQPGSRPVSDSVQISRRKQLMLEQQRRAARRSASASRLNINMNLTVQPNTEVQLIIDPLSGDILRSRGNGNLRLSVNPSNNNFFINGDYNISEGSMRFTLQNLVSRNFTLQRGSMIQFTDNPLDAMLNVTALYNVKASLAPLLSASYSGDNNIAPRSTTNVDCIIYLKGRLTDPDISFDVQVPNAPTETQSQVAYAINSQEMMATQFIWLLATKRFYPVDGNIGSSMGGNLESAGEQTGIDFLTNQLSALMTTERFSFIPKYTTGNNVYSDEVGGSIYGELIKDRLIFEADMSYAADPARSVNQQQFSGDATLSLLLDQGGNVRLKAFTRTIDRFDTDLGQQETGVGITYREDFNNFKDLQRIFRERFQGIRKRREERRKARVSDIIPEDVPAEATTAPPSGK